MAGFDFGKDFDLEKLKKEKKEQDELIRKFEKMDKESAIAGKFIAALLIGGTFLIIGYCSGSL